MNDRMVTIKGSTHSEHKEEKDDYFHTEISSGSFSRTLTLPCIIYADNYKAIFKNDLLELTLEKTENFSKKTLKSNELFTPYAKEMVVNFFSLATALYSIK